MKKKLIIIGGGAAGFFTAINVMMLNADFEVIILEQGKEVLNKVKISGGGRCNVTNVCIDPEQIVKNYPRGNRELLGPFHRFNTQDTVAWFENQGVKLKAESDGRMFPVSDDSMDIVNCLIRLTKKYGIKVITSTKVIGFSQINKGWLIKTNTQTLSSDFVMLASGSSKLVWDLLSNLGIGLISPVPSLFTFHCKDTRFRDLSGISVDSVSIKIIGTDIKTSGPLLITHQGISGPAVLKASAWGALELAQMDYKFTIAIDWLPDLDEKTFLQMTIEHARKKILPRNPFIANRLWEQLLNTFISENLTYAEAGKKKLAQIYETLKNSAFTITGKSAFKEEFVTAGGVDLQEVDFKGFFLKKITNIYLAGEVLNIDGVTGGFNFQAAWTGAFLAAEHLAYRDE